MARGQTPVPLHHENEVWVDGRVINPVVFMRPKEAAAALGFKDKRRLLKHSDNLGLTVYRDQNRYRWYSRKDIADLKERAMTVDTGRLVAETEARIRRGGTNVKKKGKAY